MPPRLATLAIVSRWCALVGGLGLAVLVVAGLSLYLVLRGGLSARAEPPALEVRIARMLRGWAIPSEAKAATNPLPPGPQAVAAGLAHFADHCASCHANEGSGRTPLGRNLYPRAPDLRAGATQGLTDGELFHVIENGVRLTGMPAWGGPGSAEGSWQLVHFIRHLPDLTAEEQARMEALNPRSPAEWRALQEEEAFLRGEGPAPRETEHGGHGH
jgi:mono/diheme cytochrome c family protein